MIQIKVYDGVCILNQRINFLLYSFSENIYLNLGKIYSDLNFEKSVRLII